MHYGHRSSLLSPLLNQNSLPNPIHNSNSRISQFKVVRYRFNPALTPKFMVVYMVFSNLIGQLRPYLPENTRSRSIPEVKLVRALLVLRFVRTWESRGAVVFFDQISSIFSHFSSFFILKMRE